MDSQKSELCLAWLFRELSTEFRGKWSAEMQTQEAIRSAKAAWWQQVRDLTREEILRGLATMPVGENAWPPGPRAFRKLCRPVDSSATLTCEAHRLYLPPPPRSREAREAAQAQLAAIRSKLPDPAETPVALPPDVPSLADRRAFIARNAEALRKAGLGQVVADESL